MEECLGGLLAAQLVGLAGPTRKLSCHSTGLAGHRNFSGDGRGSAGEVGASVGHRSNSRFLDPLLYSVVVPSVFAIISRRSMFARTPIIKEDDQEEPRLCEVDVCRKDTEFITSVGHKGLPPF